MAYDPGRKGIGEVMAMPVKSKLRTSKDTARPMKDPEVIIPKMGDVALEASSQGEEADEALDLIKGIKLATNDDLKMAVVTIAEMKDKRGAVEAVLKRFTDPLKGVIKDIESMFKPAMRALDDCEKLMKRKISVFSDDQAVRRDKYLAIAGEAASKGEEGVAQAALASADELVLEKVPGLSVRELWDGEVVDAAVIPREFLIPDVKALKAMTRARKGDPSIPGWRAFPTSSVAITCDKVER